MDKKEMKEELFSMGIKGDAAKKMRGFLKDVEQIESTVLGFSNAMQTLRQINIWEKLGLDVSDKVTSKIFFTMEDRMDELSEMFDKGDIGKKIFNGLETTMEKAAKAPGNAPEIVASYLANKPEIVQWLQKFFPDIAADLKTIADESLPKAFEMNEADWEKLGLPEGSAPTNTKTLPKIIQEVILDVKTPDGQKLMPGGVTGGLNLHDIVPQYLGQLFNAGAWHDAISNYIQPAAEGIMTDIWNQFVTAVGVNNIQPFIDFNTSVNNSVDAFLNNLFNAGAWHDAIMNRMPDIAKGIVTDIWNSFVSWIGINNIQPIIDANNSANNIIQSFLDSIFQKAEGATGDTVPTVSNTNVNKAPVSQDWVTWQQTVEEKIGFVWTKATAFVNYINTSFTSTIPTALRTTETGFGNLANFAISAFNTMISSSAVSVNSIEANFGAMHQAISQLMSALASHWSKMCNSMIANAKSAANGIIKELNRIPKKITTIHEIKTKEVAAAHGFQGMVSRPTRFLAGEGGNPEFVSITPMSKFSGSVNGPTTVAEMPRSNVSVSSGKTRETHIHNLYIDGVKMMSWINHNLSRNSGGFM